MGRIKIKDGLKKQKLSVTITKETYCGFEKLKIKNKSKLVNELLGEFFESEDGKSKKEACDA